MINIVNVRGVYCFLVFLWITNTSFGQSLWFQEGSTWVHRVIQLDAGGYAETTIEKDTVINGISCKKLVSTYKVFDFNPPFPLIASGDADAPVYMYASADDNEVYFYEEGVFKKIYDFTAQVGDIIELPYNTTNGVSSLCPNNNFIIDSVGTDNIDGVDLKWMSVSPTEETQNFYDGKIYQKMGSTSWFFTTLVAPGICIGTIEDMNFIDEFRCFSDNNFEFKHQGIIDFYGGNCYFPDTTTVGITEISDNAKLKVFPNPVLDYLNLETEEASISNVNIFNILGVEVLSTELSQGSKTVDCQRLKPGIYFLKADTHPRTVKFIKL